MVAASTWSTTPEFRYLERDLLSLSTSKKVGVFKIPPFCSFSLIFPLFAHFFVFICSVCAEFGIVRGVRVWIWGWMLRLRLVDENCVFFWGRIWGDSWRRICCCFVNLCGMEMVLEIKWFWCWVGFVLRLYLLGWMFIDEDCFVFLCGEFWGNLWCGVCLLLCGFVFFFFSRSQCFWCVLDVLVGFVLRCFCS